MKQLIEKLKSKSMMSRFLSNTSWLVFDKLFHMGLSLIVTGMLSRYLGVYNFGMLNYGLAFIEIFTIVCKLGIDGIIVNELVKTEEKKGEIMGTTFVLRLISSLLSLLAIGIFVKVLNPGDRMIQVITIIQSISLLLVAVDTLDFYFQSRLESKYTAIARSISYPIVCLFRLWMIYLKAKPEWFAWATVLDAAGIGILLLWFYYRHPQHQKLKCSVSMMKYLLSHSYHFILVNLLVTIYTQMDKLMVGSLSNQTEVGLYTAGMTVANLWIFVPNALIDSGRPVIMSLKANKEEADYEKRLLQLSAGIIWVSILAGIFFSIFGKFVILTIYGKDFLRAVSILLILIWSRLFSLMGALRSVWMLCEGMERDIKYFIGLGAVINIGLNLLFIPKMGAVGAAIATLITEVVSSYVATGVCAKTRKLFHVYGKAVLLKGCFRK